MEDVVVSRKQEESHETMKKHQDVMEEVTTMEIDKEKQESVVTTKSKRKGKNI